MHDANFTPIAHELLRASFWAALQQRVLAHNTVCAGLFVNAPVELTCKSLTGDVVYLAALHSFRGPYISVNKQIGT